MSKIEDIVSELESLQVALDAYKQRSVIYQVSAKENLALKLGLPIEFFYELSYQDWCDVKKRYKRVKKVQNEIE